MPADRFLEPKIPVSTNPGGRSSMDGQVGTSFTWRRKRKEEEVEVRRQRQEEVDEDRRPTATS